MDWNRVETLLNADVDKLAVKTSNAGAALTALAKKIRSESEGVEADLQALQVRLDELPVKLRDAQGVVARCDAIVVKARGDGREDLAAAALARRAKAASDAATMQNELDAGDAELTRMDDALTQLGKKAADVEARLAELGLSDGLPDMAGLDDLPTGPAAPPSKPAAPAASAAAKPAAPAAAKPGDDLDAQFADLLAGMGEAPAAPAKKPVGPTMDDDDLGLPDLVEVGDGELPEGADPDAAGPIDFSALDALSTARRSTSPT